jgi:hypothetical protein
MLVDKRIRQHTVFGLSLFLITQIFNASALASLRGEKNQVPPKVPVSYTVFATPYVSPRFNTEPVIVKSVTTDARDVIKGWRLSKIQLESRVGEIRSVVIACFVTGQDRPGEIIESFETPELPAVDIWKRDTPWELNLELISHRDLIQLATQRAGALQTEERIRQTKQALSPTAKKPENPFQVDVAITRIQFMDGTTWEREQVSRLEYMAIKQEANDVQFVNASLRKPKPLAPPCPRTACNYYYSGQPCQPPCLYFDPPTQSWICSCQCNPNYYYCVSNPGPVVCTLSSCNQSCTTTTCP